MLIIIYDAGDVTNFNDPKYIQKASVRFMLRLALVLATPHGTRTFI